MRRDGVVNVLETGGEKVKRSSALLPKAHSDLHPPLYLVLFLGLQILHTPPHCEVLAHLLLLSASLPLSYSDKFLAFIQQAFIKCLQASGAFLDIEESLGTAAITRCQWGRTPSKHANS